MNQRSGVVRECEPQALTEFGDARGTSGFGGLWGAWTRGSRDTPTHGSATQTHGSDPDAVSKDQSKAIPYIRVTVV